MVKEFGGILVGSIICALAFVLFINPYKLVPGGVFGICIILHHLYPSVQVGTFGYILEVPILILSAVCLGSKVGVRTLIASYAVPFFMNLFSSWFYPTVEALEALDPAQLLDGRIDLSNDKILACLLGPMLMGIGTVLIIKGKASSGGSDVIAMIISRYVRTKFSSALLMVDGCVVLAGLLVIGLGIGSSQESSGSWVLSIYSLLCIYVASRTVSYMMTGSKNDKIMFIITPKQTSRLRHFILHDLDRTATCLPCSGLYKEEDKQMLMLVIHQKEVDYVTTRIKNFCPETFIVVSDAYDAYGERWRKLPEPNELVMR
ncbi:MAG: YitT family protein [Bacteroidales bacterium]|nr:YitT family protein [Bacteroidales bacterium]